MKTTLLITGFVLFNVSILFAQAPKDTIEIRKGLATSFVLQGKKLTPKQLSSITESNPVAHVSMKKAKSNYSAAYVFSTAGSFLVGYQLGSALAGNSNWAVAGIGGGLILFSIPFSTAYVKHARNAVTIYNNGLNNTSFKKVQIYPGFTSTGLGVTMRF